MKVTIKRVIVPGEDPRFEVRAGDKLYRMLHYRPDAPADDVYNEASNLAQAKAIAAQIESGGTERVEEILYESPDDLPEELFNHEK